MKCDIDLRAGRHTCSPYKILTLTLSSNPNPHLTPNHNSISLTPKSLDTVNLSTMTTLSNSEFSQQWQPCRLVNPADNVNQGCLLKTKSQSCKWA